MRELENIPNRKGRDVSACCCCCTVAWVIVTFPKRFTATGRPSFPVWSAINCRVFFFLSVSLSFASLELLGPGTTKQIELLMLHTVKFEWLEVVLFPLISLYLSLVLDFYVLILFNVCILNMLILQGTALWTSNKKDKKWNIFPPRSEKKWLDAECNQVKLAAGLLAMTWQLLVHRYIFEFQRGLLYVESNVYVYLKSVKPKNPLHFATRPGWNIQVCVF